MTLNAKDHHGRGSVVFAWQPQGNFLATCGQNRVLKIFNRQGDMHAEIPLDGLGPCVQLAWDKEGSTIAALQAKDPAGKEDNNEGKVKLWVR